MNSSLTLSHDERAIYRRYASLALPRHSPSAAGPEISTRMETMLLDAALEFTHGNQVKAARVLGISRSTRRQWQSKRLPHVQ